MLCLWVGGELHHAGGGEGKGKKVGNGSELHCFCHFSLYGVGSLLGVCLAFLVGNRLGTKRERLTCGKALQCFPRMFRL